MHHALEIQEIFCNILFYCYQSYLTAQERKQALAVPTLAALARTCRTFKEPALDLLWRDLDDSSPLARCLPEASHRLSIGSVYSFNRPLTLIEWDIFRSYTHRIHAIRNFESGLDWGSVATFLDPPATEPLFPNLRKILGCACTKQTMALLHLPLPSLVFLGVVFESLHLLKSFPNFSPNITWLHIRVRELEDTFIEIEPSYIARWQNLRFLICRQLALDMDALMHLSRLPALIRLEFALNAPLPPSDTPLFFSRMHEMNLHSRFLEPILCWLSQSRLPAIVRFSASVDSCSSNQDLTSFLAGVPMCNASHTVETLTLRQSYYPPDGVHPPEGLRLCSNNLRPWMVFKNLRHIELDIDSNVDLTDTEMLTLASAWPQLTRLLINEAWGWKSHGGITPGALVRLLETCRSLEQIALAIDTRGYTQVPPGQTQGNLGLTLPPGCLINAVDSIIEVESVPAVVSFFSGLGACCEVDFCFQAWDGTWMTWSPRYEEQVSRWSNVERQIDDALGRRSEPGD
ncbi:hypothetical protein L210DRAFT_3649048 [Boletus edulis BED1]|uniref:F-box domain-containing protein n=1 Tax=Boletus edulis BED1 TaxID=1328754 RepID=A0AAD4BLR4_BOLED|nr:hypothetical protein L210DRAFT_3649048 [Boletus edulis BED1]